MPRLPNRGTTQRAPQTGASIPELPDFNPQLAELPGAQETNASLQRWWDLIRQRIEFNNGSVDSRLSRFTKTIDGITGEITIIQEITSDVQDYLESRYTINVAAGAVVTGMTIFSATGPDVEVSEVAFQADRFKINTSSGGNKQIFSATAAAVKLGDVLTVDLVNAKVFIGTGTYANANTGFYVDSAGKFSLKNQLTFDGTTLAIDGSGTFTGTITATAGTIGGWNIAATTISKNNAILDSAGQLILGTANDIVYISATDPTYRMWVGNVAAGSATFRVSKTGVLTATGGVFSGTITATSGTIGGFTIGATTLSAGAGTAYISLNSSGSIQVGDPTGLTSAIDPAQISIGNASGVLTWRVIDLGTATVMEMWNSAGVSKFSVDANTGNVVAVGSVTAASFSGSGAALTALNAANLASGTVPDARFPASLPAISGVNLTNLNATNIASGTLNNARLPTAIDISTLDLSGNGILYDGVGGANRIAFLWNGSNVKVYVDGSVQGTIPNP